MDKVRVSILMAIYQPKERYLKKAIQSIQMQSFKDFEVIVVNDGNDENYIHSFFCDCDFEYKIITNTLNIGLTRSLNEGLKYCQGEYIARFDDDDIMDVNRLKLQYQFLEDNRKYAAVFSHFNIIDSNNKVISKSNSKINENNISKYLIYKGNCLCHSTLFMRKNVISELKGYDEKMIYAQDYDLYLRIINKYNVAIIKKVLVMFRNDPERVGFDKSIMSDLCSFYATVKYSKISGKRFNLIIRLTWLILTIRKRMAMFR